MDILDEEVWRERAAEHEAAVEIRSRGRLERQARGLKHPVEDFLWEYYPLRPGQLRRWHPGAGVALMGAVERSEWRFYTYDATSDLAMVDVPAFEARQARLISGIRNLVAATLGRPAFLGCFGWHEWAMVYQLDDQQIRHTGWPLRLGREATDALVREVSARGGIRCSHFDAYRFFTPGARDFNSLRPGPADRERFEQPGCLHAGMDIYKHAWRLLPVVSSQLVLDAFDLALQIRALDMAAAPYDLRAMGIEPILVETAEGRAAYVVQQRGFLERSQVLRQRLLDELDQTQRSVQPKGSSTRPY